MVFDPFDYIPFIGATTTVMGMKRASAGTAGMVVHIPPGFPFAKPPEKDDELFMGSSTVIVDGDSQLTSSTDDDTYDLIGYAVGAPNHRYEYGKQILALTVFPSVALSGPMGHEAPVLAAIKPLRVQGDVAAAQTFVGLFHLPKKIR
mgnify:CR=1 FL=1